MTVALTVWSGFTALCGFAGGFTQLFLCRMGVGVGEAGGVAPAYSLIADYFPKSQRARALAAFAFGIPLGTALGTLSAACSPPCTAGAPPSSPSACWACCWPRSSSG
jgi:MFS family permease